MNTITIIGMSIAAAIAGIFAYLVARRNFSGKIGTSPAEILWLEADKLREAYREEATNLREETIKLRIEVSNLQKEIIKLQTEAKAQRLESELLRAQLAKILKLSSNDAKIILKTLEERVSSL